MKLRSILSVLVISAGLLSAPAFAQRGAGSMSAAAPVDVNSGGSTVPTNSPEPLTLIALGGGAAIAGGAAYRRRKRRA